MVGLRLTLPALLAALCLSGVSSAKPKAKKAESAKLVSLCLERFAAAKAHTAFLCEAVGVPF